MEETPQPARKNTIFSFKEADEKDEFVYSDAQEYQIAKKEYANGGVAFAILRWPLILFIALAILFELLLYTLVRLWVWFYESTTRITKGSQYKLRRGALDEAKDLQEWRGAALQLDE
jgi:hypothetical protein